MEPLSVPPIKTMASPTLSAKSGSEDSKQSNNSNDATQVIDSYYSSVERKYIAPSTGSETETASFRTMVMETIKSNVSEMEQHTPRLSQLWRSAPVSFPDKIHLAQKVERDLALDPYQSTKDIKESAFYQDPLRTASSKVDMSPTPVETPKAISPHIKHRKVTRTLLIDKCTHLIYRVHTWEQRVHLYCLLCKRIRAPAKIVWCGSTSDRVAWTL